MPKCRVLPRLVEDDTTALRGFQTGSQHLDEVKDPIVIELEEDMNRDVAGLHPGSSEVE